MPPGFDRQLGSAFLDAVIKQLCLWDRLVQIKHTVCIFQAGRHDSAVSFSLSLMVVMTCHPLLLYLSLYLSLCLQHQLGSKYCDSQGSTGARSRPADSLGLVWRVLGAVVSSARTLSTLLSWLTTGGRASECWLTATQQNTAASI